MRQRLPKRRPNQAREVSDRMNEQHQTFPRLSDVTIHVCVTCRHANDEGEEANRPGARLHRALQEALSRNERAPVRLEAVRCLSVCKRPCTVAVSGAGRWAYIYGDFDPETSAATIIAGAARYAETADGIVPWRERPEEFRKNVIARIPPFPSAFSEAAE
jgi:predicted metal-binding protein